VRERPNPRPNPVAVRFTDPAIVRWLRDYSLVSGASVNALICRAVKDLQDKITSGRNQPEMTQTQAQAETATTLTEVVAPGDPRCCRDSSYGNGSAFFGCWRLAGHLENGLGDHLDLSHRVFWRTAGDSDFSVAAHPAVAAELADAELAAEAGAAGDLHDPGPLPVWEEGPEPDVMPRPAGPDL
jgi:hypothetical protein